jgi:hypothetical protein
MMRTVDEVQTTAPLQRGFSQESRWRRIADLAKTTSFGLVLIALAACEPQSSEPDEAQAESSVTVPGVTYYVATNGNDAAAGTLMAPWKTFAKAMNAMVAGDTLNIRGGTYSQKLWFTKSGEPGKYVTVRNHPGEMLESLLLLLVSSGERVEDVRRPAEDRCLERLLETRFPSPDTLLDFLGLFHDEPLVAARPEGKKAYVPEESGALKGLAAINTALVARGASATATTATIDADGTIIEAHKREATVAYEGTRGYQPLVAVWAEEALVVADEFRDGNVAGGEDPLSCAKRAFENLPPHRGARPEVARRRHQSSRPVRRRVGEVALGQGGHHRARPPGAERRAGRRRHA